MNKKIKICFSGYSSTFINKDYETLKKHFDVYFNESPERNLGLLTWIKYIFRTLKQVKNCDVTFSWFAGWNSAVVIFFSKLLKKKSIVIVGGYDAADIPDLNYGAFSNFKEKIPATFGLKNADLLLPVSDFTKNKVLEKVKAKQIKVVYNGVDISNSKIVKKEKIIVMIGNATKDRSKLKGLDTFAKVSNCFLDYKFVIIGVKEDPIANELKKLNDKLIFTGKISHEQVLKWLQRAKIYCQLSYIESFGMGIAEAMSCRCVPVVTKRGAIPEVVNDLGFYAEYGNVEETAEAIRKALETPEEFGEKGRKRINQLFTQEIREREIVKLIKELT